MFLNPFRRSGRARRSWVRIAALLVVIVFSLDISLTIVSHPPTSQVPSPLMTHKERIFIASMHWNNENILRSHWTAAVLDLVRHFGAANVYISIVESGSWDDSKGALRELDLELEKLGVERSIELDDTTHENEIRRIPEEQADGWIWTSRGKRELRRIPYLASIRNQVMRKLNDLAQTPDEQKRRYFDKVLWLNDVIFTTEDVVTLIATRGGNYAAACALDFSKPPRYYDTFALRDISGAKAITDTWPYFLAAKSRNAMISNTPVPVKSCWNGIVVFQAEPFYNDPAIIFRGLPDSLANHHLEGSECCLIHADNPLSETEGIWLNPNVRVSYNREAYKIVNPKHSAWPSRSEKVKWLWVNRWARWTGFPRRYIERYFVNRGVQLWKSEKEQQHEKGLHCIINEMQVLVENGWAHV